jgi:hypothetical protein
VNRDEGIETLAALAAPLGPFTSQAERLACQDQWVDTGGGELLEMLLDLAAAPPSADRLGHASLDDWNSLLVEVAGTLGKRHPEHAIERLLPLLDSELDRATAIDILGGVGDARAVPALDRLVRDQRLGTDDLIRVAGALGEIGGDHACRLLMQMQETALDHAELVQEITAAMQMAGCVPTA